MSENIILFGAGVVSECCLSYFADDPNYNIHGVVVDDEHFISAYIGNQKITKFSEVDRLFDVKDSSFIPCVGYGNVNADRKQVFQRISAKGWKIGNLIAPGFQKKICKLGEGNIIFPNSNVQPYCTFGDGNIVWPGALIGHHSKISDFCWFTSNCNVGGNCKIGSNSFIGMNASISNNIVIGANNILGLDCSVTKSTANGIVKLVQDTPDSRLSAEGFSKLTQFGS